MGESCPPPPIDVRVVENLTPRGVPDQTLWQWVLKNGIVQKTDPTLPGIFVEGFQQTFDLGNILKPTFRETFSDNQVAAAVAAQSVFIRGVKNRVRVIRALSYDSLNDVPDSLLVSIDAKVGVGAMSFLFQDSSFPVSGLIIGDVQSPMTAQFNRLLPLSLLPGDVLTFKQSLSPTGTLGSLVTAWIEDTPLPFRASGL